MLIFCWLLHLVKNRSCRRNRKYFFKEGIMKMWKSWRECVLFTFYHRVRLKQWKILLRWDSKAKILFWGSSVDLKWVICDFYIYCQISDSKASGWRLAAVDSATGCEYSIFSIFVGVLECTIERSGFFDGVDVWAIFFSSLGGIIGDASGEELASKETVKSELSICSCWSLWYSSNCCCSIFIRF